MKSANIGKIILTTIITISFVQNTFAEELSSTNYKIIGVEANGGGGFANSTNYDLIGAAGEISANPRNYSTNYRLNQDPTANFTASQPSIQCFETTTDGTTDCTSGPADLLSGGMVAICGPGGCYDKARFELDPTQNPSDTLYSIEISTDNFASDRKFIDGATFKPETSSTFDINDFRSETYWETEVFNVKGLAANTQYYLRITALHGDFTQSDYSIISDATTAEGTISFDIDIATSSGIDVESAPPYAVSFSGAQQLIAGAAPMTATSLVWMDIVSSASGGVAVIEFGKNGGLRSPTTSQTILSANANLDSTTEGFGLQSYYIAYDDDTYLGDLTATTNYSGTINTVGEISTTARKVYDGNGPIKDGRVGLKLIARSATDKTPATDYSEEAYFILVPRY